MSGRPAMIREIRSTLLKAGVTCPVSVRFVGMVEVDTGEDTDLGERVRVALDGAGFVTDPEPGVVFVFRRS